MQAFARLHIRFTDMRKLPRSRRVHLLDCFWRSVHRSQEAQTFSEIPEGKAWAFHYPADKFEPSALLDLRSLNEKTAGESGFVKLAPDGNGFALGNGQPVRFWAVGSDLFHKHTPAEMERHARFLAKLGVNMVRLHCDFSPKGKEAKITDVDEQELDGVFHFVAAMKKQGIYVTISPFWANTKAPASWGIEGYADKSPWGVLFFNETLQAGYKAWVREVYARKNPYTGLALGQDPAVAIIQVHNEDSLLFWTFDGIALEQQRALGKIENVDKTALAIRGQMRQLDAQLDKLSSGGDLTQVSSERPSIAYAHVLTRGVYTARMERVEANTPHYLPPLPQGEPRNRLALAEWTVSPENPLTARVTVNRMWAEVFGAGLVETTEDFGIMGQRPSHPELLDWLAVEFRESGWNMKHMYKLMVMSATYRQSAKSTPEQLAKDPKNRLLSHGPRFRMDAEMLRDIALQSGGLLVDKPGGPSVKPYQPPNVWEQVSYPSSDTLNYTQQHGDTLYRRSMYTYWKRMATMPDMDAFDAPMRDVVCTRRQRTDTPLQALVTMNDVQWVEAARALAQRVIELGGSEPEQRINMLSEILLSHDAPPSTAAVLEGSLREMQKHYATDPVAARKLVAVGEKPRDPSIPEPELAAWTMVASEMLNLDETVNK